MNSASDHLIAQYRRVNSSRISGGSEVFDPSVIYNKDIEANQRAILVEWMNSTVPSLNFPVKASSEQLRTCLIDGTVLLQILNRLRPGFSYKEGSSRSENVKKFLACMDELGILKFELSDLETGSMKNVMDCLSTLRAQFAYLGGNLSPTSGITRFGSPRGDASSNGHFSPTIGEEKRKFSPESKSQQALEPPAASMHPVGHKFHEVFQLKQGRFSDLSAAKISEMMTSNSLDNSPTQSLLSVVNGILDESIERKSYEIPHRVACLLRKVVQEIERRISTQAEHLRTQNNLFKAREEKYQSRIRVLEALASGTGEERGAVKDQLQHLKIEKSIMEGEKRLEEEHVAKLIMEREQRDLDLSTLKQELELVKETHELRHLQMEAEAKGAKAGLEERLKELELHLEDSRNQVKVLSAYSESKSKTFNEKEDIFKGFVEFQFGALQGMRFSCKSIKQEILEVHKSYTEEFNGLEVKLKALIDATGDYHFVVAENRRMFNELQELKGNIRVYCRIRPFLPGQVAKQTAVEYIGENGEVAVVNPSKQGKDRRRNFKFNKVFGPDSTQAEVYSDTQPLIRSVLDGYSVCIFAYGQTGSGKTYTMTGPNEASEEDWGVNYRALNDLFKISQSRGGSFNYEIQSTVQTNGLAVPDASMHPVTSTSDVLELMDIGLRNRAVGATSMNERSSRSHSVVSIHVRGKDLHSGAALHGNLHLVDLAGSERVDRSEATGDRLREAQHINKSLSALGDVIFALAQKNSHVPYRNSKLTQLLQSSLGGQAKTLMFVQLNPDVISYSETLSTLKFAERVSGVELGAARSSKEGRDARELMDQVASLKDTIAKKDDEIEQLELLKDVKNEYPGSLRYGNSSASDDFSGVNPHRTQKPSIRKGMGNETASYQESNPEHSDRHSEAGSQQSKLSERDTGQDTSFADAEIFRFGDGDCGDRLSDISDGALSVGEEPDGETDQGTKLSNKFRKSSLMASASRLLQNQAQATSRTATLSTDSPKGSTSIKRTGNSNLVKSSKRWQ
ncbi:kinesin motor family protein [Populus alba x Populus x berolinensis]|uniref:Kinesin motor family protein n=1 Tax=Populus alba x Populus x berolinensis TaxID=444605 RepID=A0AAD6M1K0_9ROSI|nr:kinesin motor family protein [Populus alba x Populus x berolinensis]